MSTLTDSQLQQFNDGIQTWISDLSSYLSTTTAAQSLPLLGKLSSLVTNEQGELTAFGNVLSETIASAINTLQAPTTDEVASLLNSAFQQAGISSHITFSGTAGGVQLSLDVQKSGAFSQSLPADLGLGSFVTVTHAPALNATGGLDLTMTCGVDGNGFYVDTNTGQSKLDLTTTDSLSQTKLQGKVGLLNAEITPNQANLQADLALNLGSSNSLSNAGLVRTNDLTSLTVTPSLSGNLGLDLGVSSSIEKTQADGSTVNLLPLKSDLGVAWNLGTQASPDISLSNTSVALGPLFEKGGIIYSMLSSIADLAKQIEPVVQSFSKSLPGLQGTSLLDLIAINPGISTEQKQQITEFVDLIQKASSFLSDLPQSYSTASLKLPDFSVAGLSIDPLAYTSPSSGSGQPTLTEQPTALGNLSSEVSNFLQKISDGSLGTLSTPVLSDPGSLAGLLIGLNTNLVQWDLPQVNESSSLTTGAFKPIPSIPLSLELQGSGSISENLGIGYDATGILDYQSSKKASSLLDGIYLYNTSGTNAAPLSASLALTPSATLDVGVASASVSGSAALNGAVILYPNGDGNAYPFVNGAQVPTVVAKASLSANLSAQTNIAGLTHDWTILPPTELVSYTAPANAPNYGPAMQVGSDLQLNIGDNISQSGQASNPSGDTLTITKLLSPDSAKENLSISLNGQIGSPYTVSGSLTGSATSGTITISESPLVKSPLVFNGGDANLTYTGGSANDTLTLGNGDNVITAGRGHDTIVVGNGNNVINLGLGIDSVTTGDNTGISFAHALKELHLDLATEKLGGCAEGDTLSGGFNSVTGTFLADTMVAGSRDITLVGGPGNDTLHAGSGNDTLIGVDPAVANPGQREIDHLVAGSGSDLFVLGDSSSVYYNSGHLRGGGKGDYALVQHFDPSLDTLQLHGNSSDYLTGIMTVNGQQGLGIFCDPNHLGHLTPNSELIAIVQPDSSHSLSSLTAANMLGQAHYV